jgi:secreted PhoX family phosphatase
VTLADDGSGSLSTPLRLAFDGSGNLWVADGGTGSNNTVVEFSASQLTHSGTPTPTVILSDDGHGSLDEPFGLAFDGGGNLWVTNGKDSSVVEFTPSQLASSGDPTPTVTLSANHGSLAFPTDLALDASGDLWVSNGGFTNGNASVVEFGASQLLSSGARRDPLRCLDNGAV